MATETELAWAAGFIEGEGSFGYQATSIIRAKQVSTHEPLEKLVRLFGGGISVDSWQLCGGAAVFVMFQLYPLMSKRRQEQIARVFEEVLNHGIRNRTEKHPYNVLTSLISSTTSKEKAG